MNEKIEKKLCPEAVGGALSPFSAPLHTTAASSLGHHGHPTASWTAPGSPFWHTTHIALEKKKKKNLLFSNGIRGTGRFNSQRWDEGLDGI